MFLHIQASKRQHAQSLTNKKQVIKTPKMHFKEWISFNNQSRIKTMIAQV